jgi:hypothetical protein
MRRSAEPHARPSPHVQDRRHTVANSQTAIADASVSLPATSPTTAGGATVGRPTGAPTTDLPSFTPTPVAEQGLRSS